MTLPTRPLTAIVCDGDIMARTALTQAAREAGFEVLDSFENGPQVLQAMDFIQPSLLLLSHELVGIFGLDVIEELSRREPHPEAVLITSDERVRDQARDLPVVGVPGRGDLEALRRTLADARHLFETGERRTHHDRRSGEDRRKVQDWKQVISERRSGEDRRKNKRRIDDDDLGERRNEARPDRRERQDWKQVTIERRSGESRRNDS